MSNTYFRFKQFTVHQDRCAMKVCTDACLFGAWTAEHVRQHSSINRVLDIGTGTGLLSLMIAQALSTPQIDALEIEPAAYDQAKQNFSISPWTNRLHPYHANAVKFKPTIQYDLCISNPPFFENDLKSPDTTKNIAHHSQSLTLNELITFTIDCLTDKGLFAVLLPYHRAAQFETESLQQGLYVYHKTMVRQTERHTPFRAMMLLGKSLVYEALSDEITIKINNQYTSEFKQFLSNYYLYL